VPALAAHARLAGNKKPARRTPAAGWEPRSGAASQGVTIRPRQKRIRRSRALPRRSAGAKPNALAERDAPSVLEGRPRGQRITSVNLVMQQQTLEKSHGCAPTVNRLAVTPSRPECSNLLRVGRNCQCAQGGACAGALRHDSSRKMKTRRGSLLAGPRHQRHRRTGTSAASGSVAMTEPYIRVNRDDLMNARRARVPRSCDDVPPISRRGPVTRSRAGDIRGAGGSWTSSSDGRG
jgi:hypothetical protein